MTRKILLLILIFLTLQFDFTYCFCEEKSPLSIEDIEDLLRSFVNKRRISELIMEYGVGFEKTEENLRKLNKIGADELILSTVEKEWEKNNRFLKVETDPIGATAYLKEVERGQMNEVRKGLTPLELEGLKPKEYVIKVEKEGYFPQEHRLSLVERRRLNIGFKLVKKDVISPVQKHVEIHFNYSVFLSAAHTQTNLATQWAKEIEKRTNGAVRIKIIPDGALTTADKCYEGVLNGFSDIGMSAFYYTPSTFPLSRVIDLPLGYKSGWAATKLANEYLKRFKPKEFDRLKVMYLHAPGPIILHTKRPVNNLEDIKGMKIRSTGIAAKSVEMLGGVSVALKMPETYDGLTKGTVDGLMLFRGGLYNSKIGEVAKHSVETYGIATSIAIFVVMNKNKWNGLPPDFQRIIDEVNEEWIEKTGRLWDEVDKLGKDYAMRLGNQIISLSKSENERWARKVIPLLMEYVNDTEKQGLPGKHALKFCLDYLKNL